MGGCLKTIIKRNMDDMKSPAFWKAIISEFIGTLLLVFLGCFSIIDWSEGKNPPTILQVALCFGLLIAALATALGSVSGCHINPAVTVAFLITRKICLARAALYMLAQSVGAIAGSAFLNYVTPLKFKGNLAALVLPEFVQPSHAVVVELVLTFILVFTVFAVCDEKKPEFKSSGPLVIGLSVTASAFAAGNFSGGCLNPARALGPAVMAGYWDNHWVYWCGPMFGGMIAGLLYDLLFDSTASCKKLKGLLTSVSYDTTSSDKKLKTRTIDIEDPDTLDEVKPINP